MMTLVFSALFLTLLLGWFGRRWIAGLLLVILIVLFVGEFLWEVWSPEHGFRMPWIQVHLGTPDPAVRGVTG
ncbi:hypothetical protein [Bauldia sp.]|uniref:hypothetical protein n=1 Tax=Bauldia sp. TaxID=2575872 RepID=UPI003BA8F2B5